MRPDEQFDQAIHVDVRGRADDRPDPHENRNDRAHADAEGRDTDEGERASLGERPDGMNQVSAGGLECTRRPG
jgi:hypothetical protein